ncbi:ribonuclease H family protein [Thiomicrorhabdus lithotrophica]|uniref:ribonuclease H n=1 Tax=Thiomicrorhabdus lithotrophica TaxID=2949997 RepID=A0ABY8CC91_9GAMM|nr:ribonuclease H family protein [Thiomicrorhabdus lithotrophica]WEJ63608.1 ribonuclease H family protein [Thiomicrorhabdus lithotrophica]
MAKKFYVVWQGRTPGIYTDWNSCKQQVDKFAGAKYKSFPTMAEAEQAFVGSHGASTTKKGTAVKKASSTSAKSATKPNTIKTYTAAEIAKMNTDVMIFTDGGCDPNPGQAGSGMAVYRDGKIAELWYGLYNPMGTNNTAELNALHQALMMAQIESNQGKSVTIFCDSKYSIQCVTQWAIGWQKKGWKKAGGEIKNLELIKEMFALHQQLKDKIQVLHVNGHVGVEGNELADRMSMIAIAEKETEFTRYPDEINVAEILKMQAG